MLRSLVGSEMCIRDRRYLVNDACVLAGKVNVFASIFRFEGQASVFNYLYPDGNRGPNYRDLFPTPPPPGLVPSCAEAVSYTHLTLPTIYSV